MFTVDLLKSQGLPVRTKPQGVAIFVATFAVPILVAMLLIGFYARNNVVVSVLRQNIATLDAQTKRLADSLKFKESCEKEKAGINSCIADVASSIKKHMQWSPVLMAILKNLPESIVINTLEVNISSIKKKASGGAKKGDSVATVRILKMKVSGDPGYNCDLEVKAFRDRLKASTDLGPKLEDVVIASQGHDTLNGRDMVTYDIDCIFKPGT